MNTQPNSEKPRSVLATERVKAIVADSKDDPAPTAAETVASLRKIAVYVDDEEENIFIFKRRFGSKLDLVTFLDSREALDFVKRTPDVKVVITDESMPHLSGTALSGEIRKLKPNMRFIMITGNPLDDKDLRYNALVSNKFYDFINKPLDLEGQGETYLQIFKRAMSGS